MHGIKDCQRSVYTRYACLLSAGVSHSLTTLAARGTSPVRPAACGRLRLPGGLSSFPLAAPKGNMMYQLACGVAQSCEGLLLHYNAPVPCYGQCRYAFVGCHDWMARALRMHPHEVRQGVCQGYWAQHFASSAP